MSQILGIFIIIMGVGGAFAIIPKEGYEIVAYASMAVIILNGIYITFFWEKNK